MERPTVYLTDLVRVSAESSAHFAVDLELKVASRERNIEHTLLRAKATHMPR